MAIYNYLNNMTDRSIYVLLIIVAIVSFALLSLIVKIPLKIIKYILLLIIGIFFLTSALSLLVLLLKFLIAKFWLFIIIAIIACIILFKN